MLMSERIPEIKPDNALLKALKSAASGKLTHEELFEQRVSFVYGSLKLSSSLTKGRVREIIKEQEGRV